MTTISAIRGVLAGVKWPVDTRYGDFSKLVRIRSTKKGFFAVALKDKQGKADDTEVEPALQQHEENSLALSAANTRNMYCC